jgi:hypothetical protein
VRRWRRPRAAIARAKLAFHIAEGVVRHDRVHTHAERGEPRDRVLEKRDGTAGGFVGQEFGIGDARAIVDRDVEILPPGAVRPVAWAADRVIARDAVPDDSRHDAPQFLRIDVQQLPRALAFIAHDRRRWP